MNDGLYPGIIIGAVFGIAITAIVMVISAGDMISVETLEKRGLIEYYVKDHSMAWRWVEESKQH